ncbi:neutral/alkaline non-lysosomal ceramidase N-terminal domain-containing protein [Streptomyces lutosisoli]|uniref:Neutral/alkaline non-lysosomal ceramidase N-terminal domain-containing protein n=1 Tax=Streptomyces lutosisoli TaxID=2665721 RepID=A0ABW2VR84_9ACTN
MTVPNGPLAVEAAGTTFLAGAGKRGIGIPASVYPVDGFTAERDRLRARVVLLDDGTHRVALAVVDLTSVFDELLDEMKHLIGRAADVAEENVVIAASHTFCAPHVFPTARLNGEAAAKNEAVRQAVLAAVHRAAEDAVRQLRPARLGFGRGVCHANVNRNVLTADGWWLGADESGPCDRSVGVVRVDDTEGRPIALLINYAVQSSVLHESVTQDGGRLVSADLAGAATGHVERQYGEGTVALFLIGAAGDQAPYLTANRHTLDRDGARARTDAHEAGHLLVDLLGERLGAEAVRVGEGIRTTAPAEGTLAVIHTHVEVPAQVPPASLSDLRPTRDYPYRPNGTADAPVVVVRLGDIVLAGVQAELSSTSGLHVKENSPFPNTMVATMVDGAAKYMADARDYDRITYGAMNSRYAKGAAETVTAKILDTLHTVHNKPWQGGSRP